MDQALWKTGLSWCLYQSGDLTSRMGNFVGVLCESWNVHVLDGLQTALWQLYQTLMRWSVDLDPAGKVWKYVDEDTECLDK